MGFKGAPTEGAAKVLAEASQIIKSRGHSKGVVKNPSDGSISVVGAIACACGVEWGNLTDDEEKLVSLIPRVNLPKALLAWECAEAMIDDLYAWEDCPSTKMDDVIAFLVKCSDRMAIVIPK